MSSEALVEEQNGHEEVDERKQSAEKLLGLVTTLTEFIAKNCTITKSEKDRIVSYAKKESKTLVKILLKQPKKIRHITNGDSIRNNNLAAPRATTPEFAKYVSVLYRSKKLGKLPPEVQIGYDLVTKQHITSMLLTSMILNVDMASNPKRNGTSFYTTDDMKQYLPKVIESVRIQHEEEGKDTFDPDNFTCAKVNCLASKSLSRSVPNNAQKDLIEREDTRDHLANFQSYLKKHKESIKPKTE